MSADALPPGLARRPATLAEVEDRARRYRTWGEWGADDELGAANRVTEPSVLGALRLPRRGAVFSLALPLDDTGPMTGRNRRVNAQHVMLRSGADIALAGDQPPLFDYTDDALYLPLQASTQWDALGHIFFRGYTYQGRGPETIDGRGAHVNSVTSLCDRALGRGVLLDIPRWLGREWLEAGEAIQAEDLAACADAQGVTVGSGDFVLVRTGQLAQVRRAGRWGDYAGGPAPGLGLSAADYLCPRGVVGVASDTWGVEVIPYETDELRAPLHVVLLVHAGIYLAEMWDLEALAEDCATDGRYEFLLVAPPLNITGAVGSPVNPLAIK